MVHSPASPPIRESCNFGLFSLDKNRRKKSCAGFRSIRLVQGTGGGYHRTSGAGGCPPSTTGCWERGRKSGEKILLVALSRRRLPRRRRGGRKAGPFLAGASSSSRVFQDVSFTATSCTTKDLRTEGHEEEVLFLLPDLEKICLKPTLTRWGNYSAGGVGWPRIYLFNFILKSCNISHKLEAVSIVTAKCLRGGRRQDNLSGNAGSLLPRIASF